MFAIAKNFGTSRHRASGLARPALASFVIAALSAALLAPVSSATAAPQQQRFNPPPSAELSYSIRAQQSGINVKGDAVLRWSQSGKAYEIFTETNAAIFGKILETQSQGAIGPNGLAPASFREQRYRKREAVTRFDHAAGTVSFSESERSLPLQPGVQDRASVVWQLISAARAAPARFKPGYEWTVPVTGRRKIEPWTFRVVQAESIDTPLGTLQALHLQKISDNRDQEVDLWLAPSLQWYPVKLRYSDRGGATIDQTLKSVR